VRSQFSTERKRSDHVGDREVAGKQWRKAVVSALSEDYYS